MVIDKKGGRKSKPIRRSKMNKRKSKEVNIVYSNIQGFTGKKTSITEIMESMECDVCMLTETMTTNVKLEGMKCITSKKSIGQNVAIILRSRMNGVHSMKLYEPNEMINMLGIRLEVAKNNFKRLYTAHMKQLSTNTKDLIRDQFIEIANQFKQAAVCKEGMLLICDANVHVGQEGIPGCEDVQDWGGAELLEIIKKEGLHLINSHVICDGIVTRVDPRNGTRSTLDLVICNEFMVDEIQKMKIDEEEMFKPTKYTNKKVTKTDHHTIAVELKVNKMEIRKCESYVNTRSEAGKVLFKEKMKDVDLSGLFQDPKDINVDYKLMMNKWMQILLKSFKKITPSKNRIKGMDENVKELLKEERKVKKEWQNGIQKDNKLKMLREEIGERIAENIAVNVDEKLDIVCNSKCPQAEVFKIRRESKKTENMDFPLKDMKGNIRVTKKGIDEVITAHFKKVFSQNPIADEWDIYWKYVDSVYNLISKAEKDKVKEGPTLKEISQIIDELDKKKAVYGEMKIDLIKIAGDKFRSVVQRCVTACFESCQIPDEFRVEKMVLLYKHKGKLDEIDNYRGIFLRVIILSIYQKWLYMKCAPTVNENGSDVAFGGRKGKSTIEALLIVKLLQDHARWTKEQMIFKFLDVEKFFDSMNFKKAMLDLFNSGINGHYWKAYENINQRKKCIPFIPSGKCSSIEVKNVFVQGSTDAVLLAWNHMDTLNKKDEDLWSKRCVIEGIKFDAITFVDDIAEICKTQFDLIKSSARLEVFQNETRLRFKPTKCKMVVMNEKEEITDSIGKTELEKVQQHPYLGTIISSDGSRNDEIKSRIAETKSVCNEIVQILKSTELSRVRLRYVIMLSNACVDAKVKYGCAIWNKLNIGQSKELNDLKINLLKRVLELSYSTPSSAIQYEFGLTDLDLDVSMEKVMVMCGMKKKEEYSVGKTLLESMLKKRVPGFCVELMNALQTLGMDEKCPILTKSLKEIRQKLKSKIIKVQSERLVETMMKASKTDRLFLHNYSFNGTAKKYLIELPFEEARVIFMLRCKMFPTKENFKGRWGSEECTYCQCVESDVHLFSCAGYNDLLEGEKFDAFISLDGSMDELSKGAKSLLKVKKRLEVFNN